MDNKSVYDSTNVNKVYDSSRKLPPETLHLWLDAICSNITKPIQTIADLGCGTGRFSVPLAKKFKARVYGIDPSEKMLSVACERDREIAQVQYSKGSAEYIPLEDKSISMVFMSMAYHHIGDMESALSEIKRVLVSKGYVVIRNATQDDIHGNKLFNYFPTAKQIELQRMPLEEDVVRNFVSHGFKTIYCKILNQLFSNNYQDYYEKIAKRGLSVFNAISDQEFEEGLKNLKKYCEQNPDHYQVYEKFHLFIFQKN
jgi:ubiquinone/menaquinone biosynthesis C-methylase UbiE